MAIDPAQIELTPLQEQRLASIAERQGKDYSAVVDQLLESVLLPAGNGAEMLNGGGGPADRPRTAYEAFAAVDAIGCFEGPADLSTNPRHMEGFGNNASRRNSLD